MAGWRGGGGAGRAARRSLQGSALGGSGSDGSPNLTSGERVLLGELGLCLRKFPRVRARRLGLKRRLGSKGRRSCEGLALPERQLPHLVGKGVPLVPRRWRCCEHGSGSTEHTAQHGARHWLVRAHRLPSFPVSIVLSADIRPAPAGRVPAWGRTQQPRTQVPKSLPLGEFAASCLGREDRRQANTSRREAASPTTGRGAVGNGEPGTAQVLVRHALMASSLSFPQPAPPTPPPPPLSSPSRPEVPFPTGSKNAHRAQTLELGSADIVRTGSRVDDGRGLRPRTLKPRGLGTGIPVTSGGTNGCSDVRFPPRNHTVALIRPSSAR